MNADGLVRRYHDCFDGVGVQVGSGGETWSSPSVARRLWADRGAESRPVARGAPLVWCQRAQCDNTAVRLSLRCLAKLFMSVEFVRTHRGIEYARQSRHGCATPVECRSPQARPSLRAASLSAQQTCGRRRRKISRGAKIWRQWMILATRYRSPAGRDAAHDRCCNGLFACAGSASQRVRSVALAV